MVDDANRSADVMAILWVDRNRRYFVSNAEGVEPAEPIFRIRWRQVDDMEEGVVPGLGGPTCDIWSVDST